MRVTVQAFGQTDRGKVRKENQDEVRFRPNFGGSPALFLVCDGMGGLSSGGLASRLAADVIMQHPRLAGSHVDESDAAKALLEALRDASSEILGYALQNPASEGLGTTATVALLHENTLIVGNSGDSRAYLFRAGILHRLTRDQSAMQDHLDRGGEPVAPDSFAWLKLAGKLTNRLGTTGAFTPEITAAHLCEGDVLLLSSDGLHGKVAHGDIEDVLKRRESCDKTVSACIRSANANGGGDNIGVVVARFSGGGLKPPTPADHDIGYPNCRFPTALL